jgi:hypothetical protein
MDLFGSAKEQPTRKEIEGSNGIVYQLNGGFEKHALEKLIEYAYTARYVRVIYCFSLARAAASLLFRRRFPQGIT